MKQLEGKLLDVPVVTIVDVNTVGAQLVQVADGTTGGYGNYHPAKMGLFVVLTGGTSVQLIVHVKDTKLGWARASDTGNLGMLGGATLPSGTSYVFLFNNGGIFEQLALLAVNNIGGVAATATLIEWAEYAQTGR